MEADFWHQRWQDNEIGFHQSDINPFLLRHWPTLPLPEDAKVLVPLCGKSKDMLWLLEQGVQVTGIELSKVAVKAFAEENQLPMSCQEDNSFTRWSLPGLELLAGDFFSYQVDDEKPISVVYDRAALIALPKPMRQQYSEHIAQLLSPGGQILLLTMEYPQSAMSGPPFSVEQAEVEHLYGSSFDIELLERADVLEDNLRFKERGVNSLIEKVYRLIRR
ncbi:MAG: thiopurine S-methyltransferase [Motiliproteus sp.]|nr:thiopurine S-methyltransferase [Motiliproteus sp.]MCW9051313.1 thiopurine S-methyltransferase [Motiliproteus sp.]